jgi:hypothetical protein
MSLVHDDPQATLGRGNPGRRRSTSGLTSSTAQSFARQRSSPSLEVTRCRGWRTTHQPKAVGQFSNPCLIFLHDRYIYLDRRAEGRESLFRHRYPTPPPPGKSPLRVGTIVALSWFKSRLKFPGRMRSPMSVQASVSRSTYILRFYMRHVQQGWGVSYIG